MLMASRTVGTVTVALPPETTSNSSLISDRNGGSASNMYKPGLAADRNEPLVSVCGDSFPALPWPSAWVRLSCRPRMGV